MMICDGRRMEGLELKTSNSQSTDSRRDQKGDRALALIDHRIQVLHVQKAQNEPLNRRTDLLMQSSKVHKILLSIDFLWLSFAEHS